jgi:hypothetical protein
MRTALGLKDLDRPQRRRRRIPKRHMEPVPQPVLIGRNEWAEAGQWGAQESEFGRGAVRVRFVLTGVLWRDSFMVPCIAL